MSCCAEFEKQQRILAAYLTAPSESLDRSSLFAQMQEAVARLRNAGCYSADERRLLMPVVLRLLLEPELDAITRANLNAWVEVLGPSEWASAPLGRRASLPVSAGPPAGAMGTGAAHAPGGRKEAACS
jgi:hypothetical protein